MAGDERGGKNNPWEQWGPQPTDIDLTEVHRFYEKYGPIFQQQPEGSLPKYIRREIEKEYGTSDFAIRAQVSTAKGREPVIAMPYTGLNDPINFIFNVSQTSDLVNRNRKYYAQIGIPGREEVKVEARIVSINAKVPSSNHVVISQALREKLGIEDEETIRIVNVYQDLSTLDLDEEL